VVTCAISTSLHGRGHGRQDFINYRRDDGPGYTQTLYQRLEDEFGSADLFMDFEGSIKPDDDFVKVLTSQVGACDVMLAIIGPR
jgi:hypothetical protein